jgi:hypothetical protein
MRTYFRWALLALLATVPFTSVRGVRAQGQGALPLLTGQTIQPAFEGWWKNGDGTFDLFFGYLNRNYEEAPNIPIGPENRIDPGGPDQGQPTHFYPRRQEFLFRVNVPKDWGNKDLVWSLTSHGVTLKAYGSLLPVWEVDLALIVKNSVGSGVRDVGTEVLSKNKPPSLAVDPVAPVAWPNPATLTVSASDDGIPTPRQPRPEGSGGGGRGRGGEGAFLLNAPPPPESNFRPLQGLSYNWMQYRGPGVVTFDKVGYAAIVNGGRAVTTARFSEPGIYVLRVRVSDSILETTKDITVTVNKP